MICAENLTKIFDGGVKAVDDVSFELEEGRTLALIGPSGCGKTTTLKMLNRLHEPTSGRIVLSGVNLLEQNPIEVRRSMGYVIQGGGLFPHWTVQRNVGLVPRLVGWDKSRTEEHVRKLLTLVGLEPAEFAERFPAQLSGGEQQRVGIARAMAGDPPVILLDEPFSALDPITRRGLQREFLHLKETVRKTMVFVTHDLKEAFLLADEILLLNAGCVAQYATPEQLRAEPANDFVREFVETELA
jgi:osmoprotectant transport system ATP-binding protein